MKLMIRLLQLLVGLSLGYMVAKNITYLDKIDKFFFASVFVLCIGYFFNWWNIRLMRTDMVNTVSALPLSVGKSVKKRGDGLYAYLGHSLFWVSAFIFGYGFAVNNTVAMILGACLWWLADELLVNAKKRSFLTKQAVSQVQTSQTIALDPVKTALLHAIEEKRKTNPIIGLTLGAKQINHLLIEAMKNEKGVHVESLLCALGALAGYSCQANLRAQALEKGLPETAAFIVVEAGNGKKYFFGDILNQHLAESKYSVWSLAAGAVELAEHRKLPDITAIFSHVTNSVGSDDFGIPRFPENHQAGATPISYLKALWPNVMPLVKQFCQNPPEWPILFGLAIQEVIDMGKGVIAPDLALSIVMESAIPMSKIDLDAA